MGVKFIQLTSGIWKLIRGWNLLIICLIFFLVRKTAVLPILEVSGISSSIRDISYLMILMSTVLIAAGGNIINDIFDIRTDAVNKPGRNIVGQLISQQTAMALYVFLTVSGITIAYYSTRPFASTALFSIFPASAGLLYFYSSSYKNIPLLGNLVIAILGGLSVFTTILFDQAAMNTEPVKLLVAGYAVFAFLITLCREIIKDCEDLEGDRTNGSRTFAVAAGADAARRAAALTAFVMLCLLVWVQVSGRQWEDIKAFAYVTLLINLPVVVLIVSTLRSRTPRQDRNNGRLAKFIMITGILSMAVFYSSF